MVNTVHDVASLESVVGRRPVATAIKSIDHLDPHCQTILRHARFGAATWETPDGTLGIQEIGGAAGFAEARASQALSVALPRQARPGSALGLLMMVPGWRETLRINGRRTEDGLAVEEAFLHCGKAIIRSGLWGPARPPLPSGVSQGRHLDPLQRRFLEAAPFVLIGSCDAAGHADTSPKGDPSGFVQVLDNATILLPERRGNRRTDTMHNLVSRPDLAVLAVVPHDTRVLELRGRAELSTDPSILKRMAIRGRTPKICIRVILAHSELRPCAPSHRAQPWCPERHVSPGTLPKPGRVWSDHLKRNGTGGLLAGVIRRFAHAGLVQVGAMADYKYNLY